MRRQFFEDGVEVGEVLRGGHCHVLAGRECGAGFCEQGFEDLGVDGEVVERTA